MRRILLLSIAGLASASCSASGIVYWFRSAAGASHSVVLQLYCLVPALSLCVFAVYFVRPVMALAAAWLLLSADFLAAWLLQLQSCAHQACTTADSLHAAFAALTRTWNLALLAAAALCLLLDFARPAAPAALSAAAQDGPPPSP